MRRRKLVWSGVLLGAVLCSSVLFSRAQEAAAPSKSLTQEHQKPSQEIQKPAHAYRLDFSVNEIEDGKKINTRQYSMNLQADDAENVKIGTRVPVQYEQGKFQYIDVGTSIWCNLKERDELLLLNVRSEISNFALPEQQSKGGQPVLRTLTINASTVATPGKTTVIGSLDDPSSPRQFQLEVTATRVK